MSEGRLSRMREAVSVVCGARGRLTLPEGLKAVMPGASEEVRGGRMMASRIDAVPLPLASAGLSARAGVSVRPRPLPLSAASCGREGMAGRAAVVPPRKTARRLKGASALPALSRASLPSGTVCRPSLLCPRPRKAVRFCACPLLCARAYSCTAGALPHECGLLCVSCGRRLCQKD